jgi:hypothetical protein
MTQGMVISFHLGGPHYGEEEIDESKMGYRGSKSELA